METPRAKRQWIIAGAHPDTDRLAREARIPPLVAQLLLNRDVLTAADAERFLNPSLRELLPPDALPNAVPAAERLAAAVADNRKIVIYGDYDVDGVTATTILWHVLRLAGANVEYYIPKRLDEGYGVNMEAIESLAAAGAGLIMTVDCGVTATECARRAKQLGVELIITDHHEPRDELPDALLVHPTANNAKSANPHLSGAGVALKVAWAFAQAHCRRQKVTEEFADYLQDATAFAALGLVADVVPLVGENRTITAFGLRRLCHTRNPGLQALIEVSGLTGKRSYDEYDVGFTLAPRLNAIGRMGDAALAVELFTTADAPRAVEIAKTLDAKNRERQSIERGIVKQAEALVIERGFHRDSCRGIVLASPDWHAGVIGIVASRLVDRFHRPTVLIAMGETEGQGSGRSIRHFPLHEVLGVCDQYLLSHGGHAMAAGVRIDRERVDDFTNAFLAEAANRLTPADLSPKLRLDGETPLAELTPQLLENFERMAPFGMGNPRPRLATPEVELVDEPRVVGAAGAHLQFTVRQGSTYRKAIAFGRADQAAALADHRRLRVAFEPIMNRWNGRTNVELKVLDLQWPE